eukprot:CAMPEP_0203770616 /NCGR_PEP_ID=MMETSP0099_2-20121227/2928_1 /ASSEMBLY_ACC=CAM_ASM_000209 /TAXON_ID=96639 /ORGANISM=" , Strain NY0313808BC1" /LENGTH=164 /DNA_ID=CAMNT_0050667809 /DNA_START=214 /DNA_END=705 /DNA_ORIENTATION=+
MISYEDVKDLDVDSLRERFGVKRKDALKIDGVNHVAWVSSDMAKTIWFWAEGLGLTLTKTIALPDGGQHFFLDGGRGASIAYFWFPDTAEKIPGVSVVDVHKVNRKDHSTPPGSLNHVALNVSSSELAEYRERIKRLRVGFVSPIIYHSDNNGISYSKSPDTNW